MRNHLLNVGALWADFVIYLCLDTLFIIDLVPFHFVHRIKPLKCRTTI